MPKDPTEPQNDPAGPDEKPPIRVPPPSEPVHPAPDAPVGDPMPRRPGY